MPSLPSLLRKQLETTIKAARKTAEAGAQKALEALAVHEADPYRHMDDGQRTLRRRLRAQARQLGDAESHSRPGTYELTRLAEKVAYDQWHRLLFARFLIENGLLISPEHGVAVDLTDCEELAPSRGLKDAWAVAGSFTATILPEAFRVDDPAASVDLPIEERNQLLRLLTSLPLGVFAASDSLGWTYQFWQAERKDEVNASGTKIGADELSPVTQLFTEDYMVDFLLDNTLGAWLAGKALAANPRLAETAQSEDELRQAVALPGCPWTYLRFIKREDGKWTPAAGTFDGWPKSAAELRALDPCMGSGHFVVAMFERLVALRMAEEALDEASAVAAVIRDNLFGLELDARCTQIGAFNLALAAWRRVGYCQLPAMHIACSGLAPNAKREDWLQLTEDAPHLRFQMSALYDLFEKAPVLGSLINPRADKAVTHANALRELQPLLEKALAQETKDDTAHEMAVTARGLAKAAEILAGQFTLVATNVPYLGQKKQGDLLKEYCDRVHYDSKADLATSFLERCLAFSGTGCTAALVTPQNWLFLGSYKVLRRKLLDAVSWDFVARLGGDAFNSSQAGGAFVALHSHTRQAPNNRHSFDGWDVSDGENPQAKANALCNSDATSVEQQELLKDEDARIVLEACSAGTPLQNFASALSGCVAGDTPHFVRSFWEIPSRSADWEFHQSTVGSPLEYGGKSEVILWECEEGEIYRLAESVRHLNHVAQNWRRGKPNWGKLGVVVSQMGNLSATLYLGDIYDSNCCAIVPNNTTHLPALWAYCSSPDYSKEV